ncbi:IclR family transcriptional regulator [Virgibacillus halophilus]|uniref:IclR family transcriptional regulator n=1 Tax=Tigheibacillus halophilus TaxID=361280 RepID=A0ABU5C2T2_9BACI|nr:IclR family transcriptional regulator [Virgibacillus halophilus]
MSEKKKYGKVLYKSIEIMNYLRDIETPITLTELCKALDMNKGTLSKTLNSMLELGLVTRDEMTNRFTLGSRLIGYGAAAVRQFKIETIAAPFMDSLHSKIGETLHLGIEENKQIMYLKKYEAVATVNLRSRVGQAVPLYASAMGKATLAAKSDKAIHDYYHSSDIIQFTNNTLTNFDDFMADIQHIRARGYAVDFEEYELGVQSVGVAFTKLGKIYGAMSISIPKYRLTESLSQKIYPAIMETKEKIEEKL